MRVGSRLLMSSVVTTLADSGDKRRKINTINPQKIFMLTLFSLVIIHIAIVKTKSRV